MPRFEALSAHDRSVIIAALARTREWQGNRACCRIRLVRFRAAGHEHVEYAVKIGWTWITDQAETAGAAIEEINHLIATRGRVPRYATPARVVNIDCLPAFDFATCGSEEVLPR